MKNWPFNNVFDFVETDIYNKLIQLLIYLLMLRKNACFISATTFSGTKS